MGLFVCFVLFCFVSVINRLMLLAAIISTIAPRIPNGAVGRHNQQYIEPWIQKWFEQASNWDPSSMAKTSSTAVHKKHANPIRRDGTAPAASAPPRAQASRPPSLNLAHQPAPGGAAEQQAQRKNKPEPARDGTCGERSAVSTSQQAT
jgi:hypothetical protein